MRHSWVLLALLVPSAGLAETYEVGPQKALEEIGEVPWDALEAGDIVRIHHRTDPYREKIIVGGTGTQANPILIQGVPSSTGQLPVIDGEDAVTYEGLETWNEERGVVKVGGADIPAGPHEYIIIENLEIRGGRPGNTFTSTLGEELEYNENAAALFIEDGAHVVVRGVVLTDSANGIFSTTLAEDLLVEKSRLYGNGIDGQNNRHNAYTEGDGTVFQYNDFGPLVTGALGNAIYDTSAGFAFRYNFVKGGNLQIELETNEDHEGLPTYGTSFVYGNVLIEPDGDGEDRIIWWDRPGTLDFFHNTVVTLRDDTTTLFDLDEGREADVRNNIFCTTAGGETVAILGALGTITLTSNFIKDGYIPSHATTFTGTITDGGGQVGGADPGFVDATNGDVSLKTDSVCRDKGGALTGIPAEHAVSNQYAAPQSEMARPQDGPPDLGAFETVGAPPPPPDDGDDVDIPPDDGMDDPGPNGDGEMMMGGDGGGCGCRAAGGGTSHWPAALLLACLILLALRRRP